jgi:hypothetical protein
LLEKLPLVEDGIMPNRLPENWAGSNTELRLLYEQESLSFPYHASWLPPLVEMIV